MDEKKLLLHKIDSVDLQLSFLESMIDRLEKKQVAESISKITRLEKTRGDVKFHITFEEAMNVKRKVLS